MADREKGIPDYSVIERNLKELQMTEETLRQRNLELSLLHRAGQALSSTLDLDKVLVTVWEEVSQLLHVVGCSVWLIDPVTGELVCQQATGPGRETVLGWRLAPGEGLAGLVASSGKSLIVADARAEERYVREVGQQAGLRLRAILSIPLQVRQKVIGVLQVVDDKVNRFNETDLTLLEPLAVSAAIAIENARLYAAVQQKLIERKRIQTERERLLTAEREQRLLAETLAEVTLALTSQVSHEAVLDEILRQAKRIVPYSTAHIMLLEDGILRVARWQGYESFGSEELISNLVQSLADLPLDAEVVLAQKPVVIHDTRQEPRWLVVEETAWIRSHVAVPICLGDRILGLLRLDSDSVGEFSHQDAQRLQPLANAAAIAIENARLYERVQRHATEMEQRVADRTRELAEANERLKELDRLKSKFVSDVSHELRTPVSNIILYLTLLDRSEPEKHAKHVMVLKDQARRLANLIEDILSLSRLELGKEKIQFAAVDLNVIVKQVVVGHQQRAEAANLELIFELCEHLPPVWAERNQLAQLVTNLVANAINYTPAGWVKVTTQLDRENKRASLEVQDSGIGIEAEDLPHLFDRFYRGKRASQSEIPGTGLGLAIAKEIVDLHDGDIKVSSQVGQGTTFTVWLPLAE